MTTSDRRRSAAPVALLALLPLLGCGGSSDGACGPITREALDPAFAVHVLGEDTGVVYGSDPPTSGPHQQGPQVAGTVDEPLSRPVQVGVLERGDVLLQHDPDLPADDLRRLRGLGGDRVIVAPNPDLSDPVVATAWLYKRACDAVDVGALQTFVDERAGQGPEG